MIPSCSTIRDDNVFPDSCEYDRQAHCNFGFLSHSRTSITDNQWLARQLHVYGTVHSRVRTDNPEQHKASQGPPNATANTLAVSCSCSLRPCFVLSPRGN